MLKDSKKVINGFEQKLNIAVRKNKSLLCIGLDPVLEKLPKHLQKVKNPFFQFNKQIIDATHDLVCAYKPNSAFYEALGLNGILQLKFTCHYLQSEYPEIPIILDAKRGDIGSTNEGYVKFAFDWLGVDMITVHPYFGYEALKPFFDRKEKGIIVLIKSSNPGGGEFQGLIVKGKGLWMKIAEDVVSKWNINNNCMLMIGATYPKELKEARKIAGDMTFLVPGIGAQGGDVEKTVKAGLNSKKAGMIINSSRSIIFASNGADFAVRARQEAVTFTKEINKYR